MEVTERVNFMRSCSKQPFPEPFVHPLPFLIFSTIGRGQLPLYRHLQIGGGSEEFPEQKSYSGNSTEQGTKLLNCPKQIHQHSLHSYD
ncbi:hypothetical protein DAI22_03g351800 [Oryza sativa Japonica Group]|nr:hypothetical protein DAI22_03g351800 [Oryza sativa Japonica Group]